MINIEKVSVIGGGVMGRQIALNAAFHNFQVWLYESIPETQRAVSNWVNEYVVGRVAKGKISPVEAQKVIDRLTITHTLEDSVVGANLVIEAIIENENAKHLLFQEISKLDSGNLILTTNSSTMVSSLFINDVKDPTRLANLHFFNPAMVMELVEVVKGEHCSSETVETLMQFAKAIGKTPILVRKEIECFVLNRIINAVANEAYYLVENDYCSFEDVDIACEKGAGYKMGPFKTKDLTGIDLNYFQLVAKFEKTGIKPIGYDLISTLYEKGRYGRKTSHGFYDYE